MSVCVKAVFRRYQIGYDDIYGNHVEDDLKLLMKRLETEGDVNMTALYSSTSSHLFGIIYNIVPDQMSAGTILKSVYKSIWADRSEINRNETDLLCYLRRLAHRSALDFKTKNKLDFQTIGKCTELADLDTSRLHNSELSEVEARILGLAYLRGLSVDEIARLEQLDPVFVEDALDGVSKKIIGGES